jgi:hypothetical protein
MLSVLLLSTAAATLTNSLVAQMDRAGAHKAALQLQKALEHDDPLARKLRAFAASVEQKVESATAGARGFATYAERDAKLAELATYAQLKDAAVKAGVFPAKPTSFAETKSKDINGVFVSPYEVQDSMGLTTDAELPTYSDMAKLEDADTAEASFDQSLDTGGLVPTVEGFDPSNNPTLNQNFDYTGGITPSLDSLTDQLVQEAAASDSDSLEFPSSFAQTTQRQVKARKLKEDPDAEDASDASDAEDANSDDSAETEEDRDLELQQADDAQIEKAAKRGPEIEKVRMTDPKIVQEAKDMGMEVPYLEEVKMPLTKKFIERKAKVDQEVEQDEEDRRQTSTAMSGSRAEDILNAKREDAKLLKYEHSHRHPLSERAAKQMAAVLEDLKDTDTANDADLGGRSLEDSIKDAFGGGPETIAKAEKMLDNEDGSSEDYDDGESFVEVHPDGNMRTAK